MNIVDEFRQNEDRVLDRLVDGELSQTDRRALLAALDDDPQAWRRCALAFLEAQSWRWQLGRVAAEPLVAQAAARTNPAPVAAWRDASPRTFWGACLAIAACLLVAFGLGTQFPLAAGPQIAAEGSSANTAEPSAQTPQHSESPANAPRPSSTGPIETATVVQSEGDQPSSANAEGDESTWGTLTLAAADDAGNADANNQFQLRVRPSGADADALEQMLAGGQSTVPAVLVNQLEQEGWQVTRERRLLPVDLSDGRRMVVPVEEVDIRRPQVEQF